MEATQEEKLLFSYDESEIEAHELESHKEQGEDSPFWNGTEIDERQFYANTSLSEAFNINFEEFLFSMGETLNKLREPDSRTPNSMKPKWPLPIHVEGKRMGWMNKNGAAFVELVGDSNEDVSRDFIEKVLPQTGDMTVKGYELKNGRIVVTVYHHDSPMGEQYYLTPYVEIYQDMVEDAIKRMPVDKLREMAENLMFEHMAEYENVFCDDWGFHDDYLNN